MELCVEWGLSFEEFDKLPFVMVDKLLEYRQAVSEGTERRIEAQKRESHLRSK